MPGVLHAFDRQAKRQLIIAQDEAKYFHHGFLGTEHLLLALIRDSGSPAARVFKSLGVDYLVVRSVIETVEGRGNPAQEYATIDLTADAQRVLELAPREAELVGSPTVGPEHLLLALSREPGRAANLLERFGVSHAVVRETLDTQRGA